MGTHSHDRIHPHLPHRRRLHRHPLLPPALRDAGTAPGLDRLPVSIRIVLESVLRNCDGKKVTRQDVENLANWDAKSPGDYEIPFTVARIVLQDFTGVPLLVDIAAMRDAAVAQGADPKAVEPLVPVDLVVDHSVQVDFAGSQLALDRNMQIEFIRNRERYEFLKWGQQAFETFNVVPPGIGIVHQVNLEYLAKGVLSKEGTYYPDTLVGTDSHTTMINGLGVVGWGVGGIEAEAGMLGQPVTFLVPEVVGVHLHGQLAEGVTATDLTLKVTEMLRAHGVVGKFVEFYGPGAEALSLPDRATIANMAPEYGATMGFFPVDSETIAYLRGTGRPAAGIHVFWVANYELREMQSHLKRLGYQTAYAEGPARYFAAWGPTKMRRPLDSVFWHGITGAHGELVARLSRENPIDGLLYDTEHYAGGMSIFKSVDSRRQPSKRGRNRDASILSSVSNPECDTTSSSRTAT